MSIKAIRKELGLSQVDFARLFGVHQTAVSQWETGRTSPDTEMAIQIARGTGHSVDEVLGVETLKNTHSDESAMEIVMMDDSMAGARIRKGDKVYIRKTQATKDESLVCVQRNDIKLIRFLRCLDDEYYLLDAGVPAKTEKMGGNDRILGVVIGVYMSFE